MQVLQDQVVLLESLDHLASLVVLEPRATRACKGPRDPRVSRDHEVRLASQAPPASAAPRAVPARMVSLVRKAHQDPKATLVLPASLELEVLLDSLAAPACLATKENGVWEECEVSKESLA